MIRLAILALLSGCALSRDAHEVSKDTSQALDAATDLLKRSQGSLGALDSHVAAVTHEVARVASSATTTIQEAQRVERLVEVVLGLLAGLLVVSVVHALVSMLTHQEVRKRR